MSRAEISAEEGAHVVDVTAGSVRQGWCDACLTSTQVTVEVLVLAEDGFAPIAETSECRNCGPNSN
jgi:hypothetical protein